MLASDSERYTDFAKMHQRIIDDVPINAELEVGYDPYQKTNLLLPLVCRQALSAFIAH